MKYFPCIALCLTIFCGGAGELKAGSQDVVITATRKKLDEEKDRGSYVTVKTKQVAYSVTVQNKTFQEIKDLTVKYMVFYDNVKPGETEKSVEVSVRGKESIPSLQRGASQTFLTKPISLTSTALGGNIYYTNGAKGKSDERIAGVWFRAYKGSEIVGEYANPTSMTTRVWKD